MSNETVEAHSCVLRMIHSIMVFITDVSMFVDHR